MSNINTEGKTLSMELDTEAALSSILNTVFKTLKEHNKRLFKTAVEKKTIQIQEVENKKKKNPDKSLNPINNSNISWIQRENEEL